MLRAVVVFCILLLTSSTIYCFAIGGDLADANDILTVKGEQFQPNNIDTDVYPGCAGPKLPKDCSEWLHKGDSINGIYLIQPVLYPDPFYVYCDMETDGGGWTVFQRRLDGSVWFYRGWKEYKEGFGNANSEYWLGNEKLFYLTAQDDYELRVDLEDFEGETRYALYDKFRIGDEGTFYKLLLGSYSGNAGNALSSHNDKSFTTKDADHDDSGTSNCAELYKGAWWYQSCHSSNLNGLYHGGDHESYADGVNWNNWHGYNYSLKTTEMKVRREA